MVFTDTISKNRIFTGVLLIALSMLEFFWFNWFGQSTFFILGIFLGISGLFLVIGSRFASYVYIGIGLGDTIQKATTYNGTENTLGQSHKVLAGIIMYVGLWHLTFGWLSFPVSSNPDPNTEVYQTVFCLTAYGCIPFLLSPFCARGKTWAIWSVFILCVVISIGIPIASLTIPKPSNTPFVVYTREINEGAVVYLISTGLFGLFVLGAIVTQYVAHKKLVRQKSGDA